MLSILRNVMLAPLCTFRTGGKADFYVCVKTDDELYDALKFAKDNGLPIFILGSGSNVLISDEGVRGLIVHNEIVSLDKVITKDFATIRVGAGVKWEDFVCYSVENNWQGIECLAGIPGKVGASAVSNIGAYGQQVSDVIKLVCGYNVNTLDFFELDNSQCDFDYRYSIFKNNDLAISSVTYCLKRNAPSDILYHDLYQLIGSHQCNDIAKVKDAVMTLRKQKGMVLNNDADNLASVGSFFKNPIIDKESFINIFEIIENKCQNWYWRIDDTKVKVSAACLIQNCGFTKGYRVGNVGISPYHSLCIVNYGNGTSSEILNFATTIQSSVSAKFNIKLETEVRLIGF